MRALTSRSLLTAALAATTAVAIAGCPKLPSVPGSGGVDANKCGDYASVGDAGRKLKLFLQATQALEAAVKGLEVEVRTGCDAMAKELGVSPSGDTKSVCRAVLDQVKQDLSAGIKAEAKLDVVAKPAVCTVDVQAAASAAAQCEAKAEGEISVQCEGTCQGTCAGRCDGACAAKNASGECEGQCDGVCQGSCSGGCDGAADVEASAQCEAHAEVTASAEMTCTPPEFSVDVDASVVVDPPRADRALAALRAGMGNLLTVKAKTKPLAGAVTTWAASARALASAATELTSEFKDEALCLAGQLRAAGQAVGQIEASFSVSVSVSVEASATASGSAGN